MCTNALSELQPDATTTKRAQYEAFEFDLEAPGLVQVRNGSYGDEADEHTYRVTVENSVPVSCTCKADEYGSGACKHRVAIAIREPVLAVASVSGPDGKHALADGGVVVDPKTQVRAPRFPTRPVACTERASSARPAPTSRARNGAGRASRTAADEHPRARCCPHPTAGAGRRPRRNDERDQRNGRDGLSPLS